MQIDTELHVQPHVVLGKRNAPNNDYPDEQSRRKYARVYCTTEDAHLEVSNS